MPSGGIVEQDTLQRISRLSGVYTENVGLGVVSDSDLSPYLRTRMNGAPTADTSIL